MAGVNITKKKAYDLIEIKKKYVSPKKEPDFFVDTSKKLPFTVMKGLKTERISLDVSTMELKEQQRIKVEASQRNMLIMKREEAISTKRFKEECKKLVGLL